MDMVTSFGASMLPSSNEFWNVFTDVLPGIFFCAVGVHLHLDPSTPPTATLSQAVLGTIWATVLQHMCSLIAHAGYRAGPRVSHAMYVDAHSPFSITDQSSTTRPRPDVSSSMAARTILIRALTRAALSVSSSAAVV